MFRRNLRLLAFLAAVLLAQSPESPTLPAGAKAIEVMPGNGVKIKFHFVAVGKQVYQCENGVWSGISTPVATLYDMDSNLKVRHSAGPTWTTVDGKSVIKAIGSTAIHYASPDGASIDWLKLDVDRSSRTGEFSDVGIIQRLYTGGGKAPATGCVARQVYESPYTAHYYFWVASTE
jgi:hypothetical protein